MTLSSNLTPTISDKNARSVTKCTICDKGTANPSRQGVATTQRVVAGNFRTWNFLKAQLANTHNWRWLYRASLSHDLLKSAAQNENKTLSSPRAKRAGPKGLRAESARAFTGRQNSHSGRGENFLSRQQNFFTETAVTPERKVEKWFPRWEINRHAEG